MPAFALAPGARDVPASWPSQSPGPLAIVGEGPGVVENSTCVPFSGPSGRIIDARLFMARTSRVILTGGHGGSGVGIGAGTGVAIRRAGVPRSSCYIGNVLRAITRKGLKISQISHHDLRLHGGNQLLADLARLRPQPRVIAAMGGVAARFLLREAGASAEAYAGGLPRVHGLPIAVTLPGLDPSLPCLLVPCFHPAAGLHRPDWAQHVEDDFEAVALALEGKLQPVQARPPGGDYLLIDGPVPDAIMSMSPSHVHIDTEGSAAQPWCLSFAVAPGRAWVIRITNQRALRMFALWLTQGKAKRARVVLHNGPHDLPVLEAMDRRLALSWTRLEDTMVLAYHRRESSQALKSLAYRHLGLVADSYMDTVMPWAEADAVAWIKARVDADPTVGGFTTTAPGRKHSLRRLAMSVLRRAGAREDEVEVAGAEAEDDDADDADGGEASDASDEDAMAFDQDPPSSARSLWLRIDRDRRAGFDMPAFTLDGMPLASAVPYAGGDADMTARLWQARRPTSDRAMAYRMDVSIIPYLAAMATHGAPVSMARLRALGSTLAMEMADARHRLADLIGKDINPDSGPQIAKLLYRDLALPPSRMTASGDRPSTSDKATQALIMWATQHRSKLGPAADKVLAVLQAVGDYREASKLSGSFARPLQRHAGHVSAAWVASDPEAWASTDTDTGAGDGAVIWACIRGQIHSTRVTSGRISMSKPNLQAIPQRTKEGRRVREAFTVPGGWSMASVDLDQIEMRIMAHLSQDPTLIQLFHDGVDIHTRTASRIFHLAEADVKPMPHRDMAKRVGFGVITGISGLGLLDQLHLAGISSFTREDCDSLIEEYLHGAYPGVGDYLTRKRQQARRDGYAEDMWGRRRPLPAVRWPVPKARAEAERQSHSHDISGSAQGLLKLGMAQVWDLLARAGAGTAHGPAIWPILQIHDELLFVGKTEDVAYWGPIIRDTLCQVAELSVPVKAKLVIGQSWGELK